MMKNRHKEVNAAWRDVRQVTNSASLTAMSGVSRLVERCASVIGRLPGHVLYRGIKKGLLRAGLRPTAGLCDLHRFSSGRISDQQICDFSKELVIRRGYYDYQYFNVCFLNNVLALCVKAVCEGFLPRVEILDEGGTNLWELFFEQPFQDVQRAEKTPLDYDERALEAFPSWNDIFFPAHRDGFSMLYARFAVLNKRTKDYAQAEMTKLLSGRRVLGVLCRGTDYTATTPKGHPIQPKQEAIIAKVREVYEAGDYEYVYLATEDGEYDRLFRKEYGDKLLVNQRNYYDRAFSEGKMSLIKDVHFDRKDDDYLKGLEYISSLQILANCNGLVAGNCGGTQAAVFWNCGRYEEAHVYDGGLY